MQFGKRVPTFRRDLSFLHSAWGAYALQMETACPPKVVTLLPNYTVSCKSQPLTEMSTRSRKMFLGSRALPVRTAEKFATICGPIV
jgi:hypothetical protein